MNFQTASVRTWSFVHFILQRINPIKFDVGFSERLKLKDNAVLTILDPTVMSHHKSMSNCYYMVTIALSVITDNLIRVFMRF